MQDDIATLASECRAWRELYTGYDALKPGEVDTTDERGALDRCATDARSVIAPSQKITTTGTTPAPSTSTLDAGSKNDRGLGPGITESLKHLREIVEHNIQHEPSRIEASVALDLLEADIRALPPPKALATANADRNVAYTICRTQAELDSAQGPDADIAIDFGKADARVRVARNVRVLSCGNLDASHAKIGGSLNAFDAKIGGDIYARDATIGGVLDASGAKIAGPAPHAAVDQGAHGPVGRRRRGDGRAGAEEAISLPQITSCSGCGACCLHVGTPPGFAAWFPPPGKSLKDTADYRRVMKEDAAIVAAMPASVTRSLVEGFREAWQTNRSGQSVPCFWWDSETRRCKHHEHRPSVCRKFERGGEDCRRLRDEYKIDGPEPGRAWKR